MRWTKQPLNVLVRIDYFCIFHEDQIQSCLSIACVIALYPLVWLEHVIKENIVAITFYQTISKEDELLQLLAGVSSLRTWFLFVDAIFLCDNQDLQHCCTATFGFYFVILPSECTSFLSLRLCLSYMSSHFKFHVIGKLWSVEQCTCWDRSFLDVFDIEGKVWTSFALTRIWALVLVSRNTCLILF